MIQANELRIGNLVFLKSLNKNYTIECGFDIEKIEDGEDALPIPLAEEWLMKFGFEKIKKDSYSTGKKVDFNVFILGQFSYNSIQKNWWYCNSILENPPKYVHQLQNLNFALTGEELTIKK